MKEKTKKAAPKKSVTAKSSKKPAQKKAAPKASNNVKKKTLSNEIKGILLIALGLFLACAFLTDWTGSLGAVIKKICYGLFGMSAAISCIFVIVTGVKVFLNKMNKSNTFRLVMLGLIVVMTSVIVAMGLDARYFRGETLIEGLLILWEDGVNMKGSGVIGSGLCGIFNMLIGAAGTWIVSIAADLVFIILLTEMSIENVFVNCGKLFGKGKDKYKDVAENEVEFELPEHSVQSEEVKEKLRKHREGEKNDKKSGFFKKYFSGEEPIDDEDYTEIET